MRWLKSYKLFESSVKDIKSNLEYILSDFSDNYIPIEIRHTEFRRKTVCSVQLGNEYADLDIIRIVPKDNKDEFLRIYDYMESEGYVYSSMSYDFDGNIVISKFLDESVNIGLGGIDAFSNQLFNVIDETCYLKLFFRKK